MFKEIKEYIVNNKLQIIINDNNINIINYLNILIFDDNIISLKTNEKIITIKGKDLCIKKLLDNEILIEGKYNSIEFR